MPPAGERRPLPYEALEPEWEAREFQKFRASAGGAQAPYGAYLFGRLVQSDLHQSCRPALPPDVAKLNGSTIQGMCILQVVDVANIGANCEHRTEFSTAGPARTLKLGLTDGHQLVFGFEFTSLPQFSVNVPRGTKIVVENVPVRHGLLLLAPDNCQLLETSTDYSGRGREQAQHPTELNGVSAGAYSAALVTAQFTSSSEQPSLAAPSARPQQPPARPAAPISISRANPVRTTGSTTVPAPEPVRHVNTSSTAARSSASNPATANAAVPSVFVDIPSSDEDMDSDTTDPMVEHLFYSPKTPRRPSEAGRGSMKQTPSKKRPRSPSVVQTVETVSSIRPQTAASTTTKARQNATPLRSTSSAVGSVEDGAATQALGFLHQVRNSEATTAPALDPTQPFRYFTARLATLSAPAQPSPASRFQVRACVKSVVGFQFNTGRYQLRVSVEDCTATREADVAEDFVTRLMGVPCAEFLQTMKTKVQVAHGWAATMQFALMNLEGVMTFEKRAAPSTPASAPLLLLDCRDFQASDTRELLQRVKASLPHAPR